MVGRKSLNILAVVLFFLSFVSVGHCKNWKVINGFRDSAKYKHCGEVYKAGYRQSGVYALHINNVTKELSCEFDKGNAWTVILRRMNGQVPFIQTWQAYEAGFGNPQGSYFAGLAHIFALTIKRDARLQIDMMDWRGKTTTVFYHSFFLEPRETRYRLNVGYYTGSAGDMMGFHNAMFFSTYDAPDPHGCVHDMHGGWWYNYCAYTLPTGHYYPYPGNYTPPGSKYNGIYWQSWRGYGYSLKYFSMKLLH